MRPGTAAFEQALTSALDKRLGSAYGPPQIRSTHRASRNTVVYRGLLGVTPIVAKVQLTKPASVVIAEYRVLRELEQKDLGPGIRALRPVAVLEELGVLVTEEEHGDHVRTVIETACHQPDRTWEQAVAAVALAADGLRSFHDAFNETRHPSGDGTSRVRLYLDFSPKNLLIRWNAAGSTGAELILMDPPEEETRGIPADDIGGFCFDMTRVRFMPASVGRRAVAQRIDRLKAHFIAQYFQTDDAAELAARLPAIAAAEHRRATQALGWYMRPWRYSNVLRETLRLCYLGPLTAAYREVGLRASYRNVEAVLRSVPRQAPTTHQPEGV